MLVSWPGVVEDEPLWPQMATSLPRLSCTMRLGIALRSITERPLPEERLDDEDDLRGLLALSSNRALSLSIVSSVVQPAPAASATTKAMPVSTFHRRVLQRMFLAPVVTAVDASRPIIVARAPSNLQQSDSGEDAETAAWMSR